MITVREAAIISAYTGILIGGVAPMHAYIEEVMGHPVWTHELANQLVWDKIKAASKADFLALKVAESPTTQGD